MRMDISIIVNVPEAMAEQRLEFIEGVMEVFRQVFPNADPLPRLSPDIPPPVTVTIHADDESDTHEPD